MATPVWNQLAAPNYSAANGLIAQAMSQLTKAGEGLQGVAKEYKDTIQNRNLGLIQEYINSAKTPEELQSEGFQTGLAKLTENMRGEYDTSAKAQLVNKATDTLLSRKANQVSIDSNQFNLDTGRKNQLTKETTNKVLAAPPEQRDALKQAAVDANAFDPSAYQQYVQGEGAILNQNNVRKLFDATYDANVKNANLAPVVTKQNMANDRRRLQLEAQRVENERLKALSEGSSGGGKFNFATSPQGLLNETEQNIRNFEAAMVGDKAKAMGDTSKDAGIWYKEKSSVWHGLPKTLQSLVEGKFPSANITGLKDLTPAQLYTVLDNTYKKTDTGFNVSDSDFETVKKVFQNEINTVLKGEVAKRDAYAFAQIDNMLNEAYYRDPSISAKKMLDTMNIDRSLKEKYLTRLEERQKKEQKEAERSLRSTPRKDLPKPSQQGSLLETIAKASGLPNINLKPTDSLKGYLNTQAFANAGVGIYSPEAQQAIHTNLAEQGKLDGVTASRYVTDLKAKLTNKDIDPMEKTYLEQMLGVFEKNQANGARDEG